MTLPNPFKLPRGRIICMIPSRKPTRIPHYDYATPNYYFVTICCNKKHCIFGTVDQPNINCEIAKVCMESIPQIFPSIVVDKYVVMPNHVHAILVLQDNRVDLTTVVGQYKTAVTRRIRSLTPNLLVWQRSFHDHIIRDQKRYELIWSYIDTNQYRWKDDKFYVD